MQTIPICLLSYIPWIHYTEMRMQICSEWENHSSRPITLENANRRGHFLKCCVANITRKRCQEWSARHCDSWLTCRKIHKQAGPGSGCKQKVPLTQGGHSVLFESHFSALSIHSLLCELNYIRSNLVSHLFSSAGQETHLHGAAIEV